MVSTGTTLISPFSETAVEDISALVETASTTSATDLLAERQARVAEIRARRKSRRTERKSRLDTKRAAVRTRMDEQRNRQRDAREADEATRGPQLQLKLRFDEVAGDPQVDGDPLVPIEVVRVTNRDDDNVVLTSIETIMGAPDRADLATPQFTLGPGESYSFVSGLPAEDAANATKDQYHWLDKVICDGAIQRQGYRVNAAFSRGGKNYQFVVRCGRANTTGAVETPAATLRRKRKKIDEHKHNHKRNSQHRIKKKR
jgi:hypothetical protein